MKKKLNKMNQMEKIPENENEAKNNCPIQNIVKLRNESKKNETEDLSMNICFFFAWLLWLVAGFFFFFCSAAATAVAVAAAAAQMSIQIEKRTDRTRNSTRKRYPMVVPSIIWK